MVSGLDDTDGSKRGQLTVSENVMCLGAEKSRCTCMTGGLGVGYNGPDSHIVMYWTLM